jgi:hypothetical protein
MDFSNETMGLLPCRHGTEKFMQAMLENNEELAISLYSPEIDERVAMILAAHNGNERMMRKCHDEWGASNVSNTMSCAAEFGHIKLVKICHDEWGEKSIPSVDRSMKWAAYGGHTDIVELCRGWKANNDKVLLAAAEIGHIDLVKTCCEKWDLNNRKNMKKAKRIASERNNTDVVEFLDGLLPRKKVKKNM